MKIGLLILGILFISKGNASELSNTIGFSQLERGTQILFMDGFKVGDYYNGKHYHKDENWGYLYGDQCYVRSTSDIAISDKTLLTVSERSQNKLLLQGSTSRGNKITVKIECDEGSVESLIRNTESLIEIYSPNHYNYKSYEKSTRLDFKTN
jgi:hypothetical protein